jgi:predicted DNA-binding transcriptional regulator AlpA
MDTHAVSVINSDDDALDARAGADFMGVALATFWRKVTAGIYPEPYYPAERTPRWTRGELRQVRERLRMTPAEHREYRRAKKRAGNLHQNSAP